MRLGELAYLNALPLNHWFARLSDPGVERVQGNPSQLLDLLLAEELDISPVSSIAWWRHRDRWQLLPGPCVAAAGPVQSVLLFSRLPLTSLTGAVIGLTPASRSSRELVRVLLEQGGRPPAVYRTEEEETLLRFPSDLPGILLIGDRALVARHVHPPAPPWQAHDLADLWWQWTGLPMVFAVWAVRQAWARTHPGEMAWLQEQILAALAGFERQPAPVLAEAARRIPLERAVLTSYYRGLRYRLQESELAGLHRFAAEVERLPALGSPPTGQFQVSGGA